MLGLAFQNPEMTFFTSFEEQECLLCSKRTKSLFLVSLHSALCLDCFDVFFVKRGPKHNGSLEETSIRGGNNEGF